WSAAPDATRARSWMPRSRPSPSPTPPTSARWSGSGRSGRRPRPSSSTTSSCTSRSMASRRCRCLRRSPPRGRKTRRSRSRPSPEPRRGLRARANRGQWPDAGPTLSRLALAAPRQLPGAAGPAFRDAAGRCAGAAAAGTGAGRLRPGRGPGQGARGGARGAAAPAGAGRRHRRVDRRRDPRQAARPRRRPGHAGAPVRARPRGVQRRGGDRRRAGRDGAERDAGRVRPDQPCAGRGLLGQRRAGRQGRGLRHPGPCGALGAPHRGQLQRRRRPAAVRDLRAAAAHRRGGAVSTEILVNIGTQETRVALVEGGAAQEIYVQRAARHGLVGNIYKGTVKRVLPGMQAAFVDIGLERTAFLHVADMLNGETHAEPLPPVERLLHEGQEVLVQILKDPLGSKGARLTTLLSIPSRYLVLMPYEKHVGVSTKIEDEGERTRLKAALETLVPELAPEWGVIARTAAEGADLDALRQDLLFLTRLWSAVSQQVTQARCGQMVHGDLPLSMRILRDLLGTAVERVRIDNAEEARRVQQFAKVFVPQAAAKIEPYCGQAPIFDLYGVEDELNRALERKVELKSGGHLVIDQTEAMTTIDVNTGAFTGHRNLE